MQSGRHLHGWTPPHGRTSQTLGLALFASSAAPARMPGRHGEAAVARPRRRCGQLSGRLVCGRGHGRLGWPHAAPALEGFDGGHEVGPLLGTQVLHYVHCTVHDHFGVALKQAAGHHQITLETRTSSRGISPEPRQARRRRWRRHRQVCLCYVISSLAC